MAKVIYCDGSCLNNGTSKARAGIGIFVPDEQISISEPLKKTEKHTNQTAELTAAIRALQLYPKGSLKIYTDSMYVINCATKWIRSWKKNKWRKKNGKTILNLNLIQTLDVLTRMDPTRVGWIHVRGHADNKHNNTADMLARKGALQVKF